MLYSKKMAIVSCLFLLVTTYSALAQNIVKTIDVAQSTIVWKGYKLTGSHDGTIDFASGQLQFLNGELIGGSFIMDMTSINVTDLEGKSKKKLESHLKSKDFFGVEIYPTSKLVFKKVEKMPDGYKVTGDFTLKDITESISFKIVVNGDTATSNLSLDRSKFNVRYGSKSFFNNIKNGAINDEFDLSVNLKF